MGKSSSQPQPVIVNSGQSAATQAQFNKDAALQQRDLNTLDQYTPQGSIKYSQQKDDEGNLIERDGIPLMRVDQQLSPEQQGLYDTTNRISQRFGDTAESQLGKVSDQLSDPFTLDQFGEAPAVNEGLRDQTRANMIARLQPQMDRDRGSLESSLINQGFMRGSEGFDSRLDEANRAQNDLYLAADAQAGNEMARQYGLETNTRDRAISEALLERDRPMSELSTFISGSQPQSPSFVPTPQGQIGAPDTMGADFANANAQNQFLLNEFNQNQATSRSNLAGLYGLGGAGIGAAGYNWNR